jgi:copper resistance protein C
MVVLLMLSSTTLAHSYLTRSNPSAGQTVTTTPATVILEFSEPLEVAFSNFKVYALPIEAGNTDVKASAAKLVTRVLALKNDDAEKADLGLTSTASPASRLEVKLKPKLGAGWYVVMWRALSVDSHSTSDFFVFRLQPRS